MASYFSYFPNVYVGEGITSDESFKYRLVKNIFRRVKPRDDLNQYVTLFESYSIREGESPSNLAQKLYGDPFLDWVILLTNNITDIYDQWPKPEYELQEYVRTIYEDPDGVHHYETNEVLYNGIVLMQQGNQVNSTFRTTMPDGTVLSEQASIYPVSNYEHEYYLNEQKRLIVIPEGGIIDLMIGEMNELLDYEPHVELDEFNNKKTPLSLASLFLKNNSSSYTRTTSTGTNTLVTSFDYGPTASGVSNATTAASVGTAGVVTSTSVTGNTVTTTTTTTSSSSSSSSSGSSGGSGY